jgi:hypothetical protein
MNKGRDKSKSKEGSSTVTFRHNIARTTLVDGVKTVENETLLDGKAKGISFYYLFKNNSDFLKIKGNQDGNKWVVDYTKGDKNEKHEFDDKAVRDFLKKDKRLEFVLKYLAGQKKLARTKKRSTIVGGGTLFEDNAHLTLAEVIGNNTPVRRQSKKRSTKGSAKGSAKVSRKGSKKRSKKGSNKRTTRVQRTKTALDKISDVLA